MHKPVSINKVIELTIDEQTQGAIADVLSQQSGLSKHQLKNAMQKGAVWLRKPRGKLKRIRRASTSVKKGDFVALYYDPHLLERIPPQAEQLWRCSDYSVWYKPAGLLAQGNQYGDHASFLRQAELLDPLRKPVYLVHRLDREAQGLMLIAHTQTAARRLSQLFQRQKVEKRYEISVRGRLDKDVGEIKQPLDGKSAHTIYQVLHYDAENDTSLVNVQIKTGRTHQIRRHFELIKHPVMGDPKYGYNNKNEAGLQLKATLLRFECPFIKEQAEFDLKKLFPVKEE